MNEEADMRIFSSFIRLQHQSPLFWSSIWPFFSSCENWKSLLARFAPPAASAIGQDRRQFDANGGQKNLIYVNDIRSVIA